MSDFGQVNETSLLMGQFVPKQQHKFLLSFTDANYDIPAFLIKTLSRPTLTINKITHDHNSRKVHFAGKAEWEDITISLVDPIDVSASAKVMEWVNMSHDSSTGVSGYPNQYKKDLTIQILGPVGDIVESWAIQGAFITSVDFSDADSSSDDFHTITLTLSIDNAIWEF